MKFFSHKTRRPVFDQTEDGAAYEPLERQLLSDSAAADGAYIVGRGTVVTRK
jgi:hypothetical protein